MPQHDLINVFRDTVVALMRGDGRVYLSVDDRTATAAPSANDNAPATADRIVARVKALQSELRNRNWRDPLHAEALLCDVLELLRVS